jgi:uncharacterized OB-fold protein
LLYADSMDDILESRALPLLGLANTKFWTSGQDGILRFERCKACSTYIHPPTGRCPECFGVEVDFTAVSGRGTIYSFTVNHQQWTPDTPPYIVVLVDLEEGSAESPLRLTSNLVGVDPGDVKIGMAVEVFFVQSEDVWIPQFRVMQDGGDQ